MELAAHNSRTGEQGELGPAVTEGSAWSVLEQLLRGVGMSPSARPPLQVLRALQGPAPAASPESEASHKHTLERTAGARALWSHRAGKLSTGPEEM